MIADEFMSGRPGVGSLAWNLSMERVWRTRGDWPDLVGTADLGPPLSLVDFPMY